MDIDQSPVANELEPTSIVWTPATEEVVAERAFPPSCFRLTEYGRISYIYWSKTSFASMALIEHTREEAVPAFLSSGRWIKDGSNELGIRVYR